MLLSNGEAVAAATVVVVNQRRIYYLVDIHDWQETLSDACGMVIYMCVYIEGNTYMMRIYINIIYVYIPPINK
jgi:hypothetical protein